MMRLAVTILVSLWTFSSPTATSANVDEKRKSISRKRAAGRALHGTKIFPQNKGTFFRGRDLVVAKDEASFWGRLLEEDSLSIEEEGTYIRDVIGDQAELSTFHSLTSIYDDILQDSSLIWTAFAPSNDAWANFDQELLTQLQQPEWVMHLESLMAAHLVFNETWDAASLTDDLVIESATIDNNITVSIIDGEVLLNGPLFTNVSVSKADLPADNGVVHVVTGVMPPEWYFMNVLDEPSTYGYTDRTTMVELIIQAGLEDFVRSELLTILWPYNDAFGALPDDLLAELTDPINVDTLREILLYHMVPGLYPLHLLSDGQELVTVQGSNVTFTIVEVDDEARPQYFFNGVLADGDFSSWASITSISHFLDTVLELP